MKKHIIFVLFVFILSFLPVQAHPGKTDGDGCHTCRTNCEKWGLEYGEYHCHNDGNTNSYSVPSPQNNSGYSNDSSNNTSSSVSYPERSDPSYPLPNYNEQKSSDSEKISQNDFNAKKYGVVFNTKTDFFIVLLIYTAVVIFIMMMYFSKQMTNFEKDCRKELMTEKQKLQDEYNSKVQNQNQSYNRKIKNLNQIIRESADQKVLEYLLSRYQGQENPYTGKIIESIDDIKEYLDTYKNNHKDDFTL
nr:MAG TPA: Big defensin [Caudoviricetes sp.]